MPSGPKPTLWSFSYTLSIFPPAASTKTSLFFRTLLYSLQPETQSPSPSGGLLSSARSLQNEVASSPSPAVLNFSDSFHSQSWTFQAPGSVSLAKLVSVLFTTAISSSVEFRSPRYTSPTSASNLRPQEGSFSKKSFLAPTTSANGALSLSSP